MKKVHLACASILMVAFTACSSNESGSTATLDSTSTTSTTMGEDTSVSSATPSTNTSTTPATPLGAADSTFAIKAAVGGMMEVEAGNIAQQNAQNERVKAYAAMMVRDHSAANQELMSFASGRGMTLPSALPADKQAHIDEMRKMTGKAFDNHYMKMMVDDHKKTIADFQKESTGGANADLKAWATKTLPALQMHADSATAINKAIK